LNWQTLETQEIKIVKKNPLLKRFSRSGPGTVWRRDNVSAVATCAGAKKSKLRLIGLDTGFFPHRAQLCPYCRISCENTILRIGAESQFRLLNG
jgi:hypothetical protein